jgi:hypothetical protein
VHTLATLAPLQVNKGLEEAPMIALFAAAAVLLIAVIDAALFNSDQREEHGQLMEDIARSHAVSLLVGSLSHRA